MTQEERKIGVAERFAVSTGRLGALMLLPLIAVIMFDVVTRRLPGVGAYIASTPLGPYITSIRLQELEWHLHGIIIFTAIGYAFLRDTHVRIDMVRQMLGLRGRAVVEIAGILALIVPFCCVMLYFCWTFVSRSYLSGEASPSMAGLSYRWIIKSFLLLGMVLLLVAALSILIRMISFLRNERLEDPLVSKILSAEDGVAGTRPGAQP